MRGRGHSLGSGWCDSHVGAECFLHSQPVPCAHWGQGTVGAATPQSLPSWAKSLHSNPGACQLGSRAPTSEDGAGPPRPHRGTRPEAGQAGVSQDFTELAEPSASCPPLFPRCPWGTQWGILGAGSAPTSHPAEDSQHMDTGASSVHSHTHTFSCVRTCVRACVHVCVCALQLGWPRPRKGRSGVGAAVRCLLPGMAPARGSQRVPPPVPCLH